jgi:aryl-alcohol dehydrogenase-like predicted oxidoreductase
LGFDEVAAIRGHTSARECSFSVLGFGAVGGFMVRGNPADQEPTIARTIAAAVNYFDTAAHRARR